MMKQNVLEVCQERLDKLFNKNEVRLENSPSENVIITNTHFDANGSSNKMILQYSCQEKSHSPANSDILFLYNKPAEDGYLNEKDTFHEHNEQLTSLNRRGN